VVLTFGSARALALLLALGALAPAALTAQDTGSKIGDVERSAAAASKTDDSDDDDGSGGGGLLLHILFAIFRSSGRRSADSLVPAPEPPGQGYLPYPYAIAHTPKTYILRRVTKGRTFGSFSASYFTDDGSTLRAGQFSLDAAYGEALFSFEYSYYREPRVGGIDYLHLGRIAVGGLGPLGNAGFLRGGLALQSILTDDGHVAAGPELELGAQLFPARPLAVTADSRFAALTWKGGQLFGVGFVDVMGGASVFLGRFEIQAGYRWTRVGIGAPFHGPTLGMRVWF